MSTFVLRISVTLLLILFLNHSVRNINKCKKQIQLVAKHFSDYSKPTKTKKKSCLRFRNLFGLFPGKSCEKLAIGIEKPV